MEILLQTKSLEVQLMKQISLILFFFFLLASSTLAVCIRGIDGICDPNCIDVDYDCETNPYSGVQDVSCNDQLDGYCNPNCEDTDWDCVAQQEQFSNQNINNPIQEGDLQTNTLSQTSSVVLEDSQLLPLDIIFLSVGLLLIALLGTLLFVRLAQRKRMKQYESMIPSGQQALAQGYSIDDIKHSLEHKGYSTDYIKGYLRALEHKP